jgi:hypothetical protein
MIAQSSEKNSRQNENGDMNSQKNQEGTKKDKSKLKN